MNQILVAVSCRAHEAALPLPDNLVRRPIVADTGRAHNHYATYSNCSHPLGRQWGMEEVDLPLHV
ncbi:MAG TPA: hypothetical protein H9836_06750 [Candidatus Nocardiopsis merdipullorum]|nr:hypothetical protein [Candidatus Nocardiopsis merdipullorum]